MNADDEKKLYRIAEGLACYTDPDALREAFALGRRAGMTEAAGICNKNECATGYGYAAAIAKARDA